MNIKMGKEQVLAAGPKFEDTYWGVYQFPRLFQLENGKLVASIHIRDDVWSEIDDESRLWLSSTDEGKTWKKETSTIMGECGTKLPNGDRLFMLSPHGVDISSMEALNARIATEVLPTDVLEKREDGLPFPVGQRYDAWGAISRTYLYETLPDGLVEKKWAALRINAGDTEPQKEMVGLNWPNMSVEAYFNPFNKTATILAPQPVSRLKVAPDGTLWLPTYVGSGLNPSNGAYLPYGGVRILKSTDYGHTWDLKSWINYIPDPDEYEGAFTAGFNEPEIEFMPDGSMIMLIRTTDVSFGGSEWSPCYFTRSIDQGLSWSKPVRFDNVGVLPKLCKLKCGVTLAAYGRPGNYIRATTDPQGLSWENPIEFMTAEDRSSLANEPPKHPNFHQWAGSCCNLDLIAIDDNRAMVIYSDFYYPDENGVKRKTILIRTITVE